MKQYNYNDNNVFSVQTKEELGDKIHYGYVSIPIYYETTNHGDIHLDIEMILEEFQRTLMGIETVVDVIQDK